jgi:spore coat protein A, manganese oxidase
MLTRRQLVKAGTLTGAALLVPAALRARQAIAEPVPGGTLSPLSIPKYVTPLFVLPVMPWADTTVAGVDRYEIGARQFRQQILPPGFAQTAVFGYGSVRDSSTFHYPSYTIEARFDRPVRVTWVNQLMTSSGDYRPHLLPVDPTLHWANPPGGTAGRDMRPEFTSTPGPYRGPVPFVTHLHGAHVTEESDGYPEAWYLPAARNIPAGFARVGSFYDRFRDEARRRHGVVWSRGAAVFQYPNDQRATTLWFHNHELGLTRVNLYAGLTGLYLLRGGRFDLPTGVLPHGRFEVPLVIQDRSFNRDGSLFFPASRGFFGDVPPEGPFIPHNDIPPIWNPEFFGNTMVVNGRTWPVFEVERRRYRFRLLNASNTRVLMLKIVTNPLTPRPASPAAQFIAIGADGGFLPAPARLDRVTLAVAERLDVIVDFSRFPVGTQLFLINEGPDEPFGGGEPGTDFMVADPTTTGQVMKFVVTASTSAEASVAAEQLTLPAPEGLGAASRTRKLSLNELADPTFDAPTAGMLGTLTAAGEPAPLPWMAEVTEDPALGATEIWELHNFTEDAHPIHLHLVQFEVLDRRPFGAATARPPQRWETGGKDTVVALPQEVTRLKARFDIAGRFVWHCHIIDHEDNEMMRPYQVG